MIIKFSPYEIENRFSLNSNPVYEELKSLKILKIENRVEFYINGKISRQSFTSVEENEVTVENEVNYFYDIIDKLITYKIIKNEFIDLNELIEKVRGRTYDHFERVDEDDSE